MDERLLAAYLATDYRVRLARGGWASIRIGAPLPAALATGLTAPPRTPTLAVCWIHEYLNT